MLFWPIYCLKHAWTRGMKFLLTEIKWHDLCFKLSWAGDILIFWQPFNRLQFSCIHIKCFVARSFLFGSRDPKPARTFDQHFSSHYLQALFLLLNVLDRSMGHEKSSVRLQYLKELSSVQNWGFLNFNFYLIKQLGATLKFFRK